jgi:hypothetical protein
MNPTLRQIVTQRALERCEYCDYPEKIHSGVLHLDHIIPPQYGGQPPAPFGKGDIQQKIALWLVQTVRLRLSSLLFANCQFEKEQQNQRS